MTFDVVVIGGGLIGKAVALQLADCDMQVAMVCPPGGGAGGASTAAGGMLGVFSEVISTDTPELQALHVSHRWQARQIYDDWISSISERSRLAILFSRGLFVLANRYVETDGSELDAIVAAARGAGRRAERVSAWDIPGVDERSGDSGTRSIYLPDEGSVDVSALMHAMDVCLDEHPGVAHIRDRAESLQTDAGVQVALASGERVCGKSAVLAGGVEIPRLLHASGMAHLKVPLLLSGRGVSLTVRSTTPLPHPVRTPNRGFACGLHMVPRGDDSTYIGATNRLTTMPDMSRGPALTELTDLMTGVMEEFNSGLGKAEVIQTFVGHRPLTGDRLPLVGRTRDSRILVATGTYRNGILLAPLVASLIAEEVSEPGRHADHAFRPTREVVGSIEERSDTWIQESMGGLLETIIDREGRLPEGRRRDLEAALNVLLHVVVNPDYKIVDLRRSVDRLVRLAPLEESLPLVYDLIVRYGQRN